MRKRHKGFGFELDAILSAPGGEGVSPAPAGESLQLLPTAAIRPNPFQPRTVFDAEALEELAQSIRQQGVIQPIIVRKTNASGYELIAGERRWRAAELAGLEEIPAVIRDIGDREALAIALIENMQREDLNAMDEARALKKLVDEFVLSHSAAGEAVGRSRSAISNLLRLLELVKPVQTLVESGALEMGHARALLALGAGDQVDMAQRVVQKGLSVRETERLVRSRTQASTPKNPPTAVTEPTVSSRWQFKMTVKQAKNGRATVTLRGLSAEELKALMAFLRQD